MRKSITQEFGNGCGIACFAFACNLSYRQAEDFLGPEQAKSNSFKVYNFVKELKRFGKNYASKHVRPGQNVNYPEGTIVLIRRSKIYPVGHYLIRYQSQWMDPWINLPKNKNLAYAKSGYRKRLPGSPMYLLIPS